MIREIPTDARRELYGLQVICAGSGQNYVDYIWQLRDALSLSTPSTGSWPTLIMQGPQKALPPLSEIAKAPIARIGKTK